MIWANSSPGPDTIAFDTLGFTSHGASPYPRPLLGESAWVIQVASALPPVAGPLVMSGDVNGNGTPDIAIYPSATLARGLFITADTCLVSGLVLGGFADEGILVKGDSVTITGCFVGVRPQGDTAYPCAQGVVLDSCRRFCLAGCVVSGNSENGIRLLWARSGLVDSNSVGLTPFNEVLANGSHGIYLLAAESTTISRNTISGNGRAGIMADNFSKNISITGNHIGTDTSGLLAMGNSGAGIVVDTGSRIVEIDANTIADNSGIGVLIRRSFACTVSGNMVGLLADSSACGNGGPGIVVTDSAIANTVGYYIYTGSLPNLVAHNGGPGIVVGVSPTDFFTSDNRLSQNRLWDNNGLGIDLGGDGVTPNDAGDADAGPNGLLNYPVVDSVVEVTAGSWAVYGKSGGWGEVEIYRCAPDPSSHGEGFLLVGYDTSQPNGVFCDTLSSWLYDTLSTLFIDAYGNTSEFSDNYVVGVGVAEVPGPTRFSAWPILRPSGPGIGLILDDEKAVEIACYNVVGALVWQEDIRLVPGKHLVRPALPGAGAFFVRVRAGTAIRHFVLVNPARAGF